MHSVQNLPAQQVGESVQQVFTLTHQQESCSIRLPLLGIHNVRNSLAAIAACRALGIGWDPIRLGLAALQPAKGRLYPITMPFGTLLDDTYNANPLSFMAGIDALCVLSGEPWLVMGDMGELGETSAAQHQRVVDYAISRSVRKIFVLGKEFSSAVKGLHNAQVFASHEALSAVLAQSLTHDINLLVKGSRFMRMEKIVAQLQEGEKQACC
jgi:UDP-N-acetylmuramoyl-tripeptide--D-alanyl-D-alanine ligase